MPAESHPGIGDLPTMRGTPAATAVHQWQEITSILQDADRSAVK